MPEYKFKVDGLSQVAVPEDSADLREYVEELVGEAAEFDGAEPSAVTVDGDVVTLTYANDMSNDQLRMLDKAVRENMSTRAEVLQQYMDDAMAEAGKHAGEALTAVRVTS